MVLLVPLTLVLLLLVKWFVNFLNASLQFIRTFGNLFLGHSKVFFSPINVFLSGSENGSPISITINCIVMFRNEAGYSVECDETGGDLGSLSSSKFLSSKAFV